MDNINTLTEGLTELFSNDPITWVKWLLVFASFILTFVVRFKFKIDDKLDSSKKLDRKVKMAIENNHIINATLVKRYIDWDENHRRTYIGKYEYEIDGKNATIQQYFGKNNNHQEFCICIMKTHLKKYLQMKNIIIMRLLDYLW